MAEALNVPIQPLIIHGAHDAIPKNSIYLNNGQLTLKYLPPISPTDTSFGNTYPERTKNIGRWFRNEYRSLRKQIETPAYFRYRLLTNYLYKGPVLEWYARIKVALEDNYKPFDDLVPKQGDIIDLGCGYGFLCYMLSFLSEDRTITGVDYDEEKIETALNCYSKNDRVHFYAADVKIFPLTQYDGIVIADVLHYLTPDDQEFMIERCIHALKPGGRLIIREGNAELKERHQGTRATEFFSVKLLRFNKSVNELHFLKGETVREIAARLSCNVRTIDDTKFTSNVIFVIEKN